MNPPTPAVMKNIILEFAMRKLIDTQARNLKLRQYCTWTPLDDADPELLALRQRFSSMSTPNLLTMMQLGFKENGMLTELERMIHEDILAIAGIGRENEVYDPKETVEKRPVFLDNVQRRKALSVQCHQLVVKLFEKLYSLTDPLHYGEGFACYVSVLINGWAEVSKKTRLFFEYKDGFPYFLEQLQDATRQSLIYPRILETLAEEKVAASQKQQDGSADSRKAEQKDTEAYVFRTRDPNETGYTLLDGSWTYRIVEPSLREGAQDPHYKPAKPLGNKSQYDAMKAELRQCEKDIRMYQQIEWDIRDDAVQTLKNDPRGHTAQYTERIRGYMFNPRYRTRSAHVLVSHSIDKLAMDMHDIQKELDREEEDRFQELWQQTLDDNKDLLFVIAHELTDVGERYTDMMARVFMQQKSAWESGGFEGALAADLLVRDKKRADTLPASPALTSSSAQERRGVHRVSSGLGGSSTQGSSPSNVPSQESLD